MSTRSLGLDPGNEGGAVLLEVGTDAPWRAVMAWHWRPCVRKGVRHWRLAIVAGGADLEFVEPTLGVVGQRIAGGATGGVPYRLTVEGLWGRGTTLERLSWYAGLVASPLESLATGGEVRPQANVWRRQVLGLPRSTGAEAAELAAVEWAAANVEGLGRLSAVGHVCEAAAIAVWRSVHGAAL